MMRKATMMLVLLLMAAMVQCSYLADRYNASGAETDIPGLLKAQGVTITAIDCAMLPGSRAFTCTFRIKPAQAARLAAQFKLKRPQENDVKFKYHSPAGCETRAEFQDAKAQRHYRPYVPQKDRIPELANFTHMRFWYRPDLGRGCLRSSYGYG